MRAKKKIVKSTHTTGGLPQEMGYLSFAGDVLEWGFWQHGEADMHPAIAGAGWFGGVQKPRLQRLSDGVLTPSAGTWVNPRRNRRRGRRTDMAASPLCERWVRGFVVDCRCGRAQPVGVPGTSHTSSRVQHMHNGCHGCRINASQKVETCGHRLSQLTRHRWWLGRWEAGFFPDCWVPETPHYSNAVPRRASKTDARPPTSTGPDLKSSQTFIAERFLVLQHAFLPLASTRKHASVSSKSTPIPPTLHHTQWYPLLTN